MGKRRQRKRAAERERMLAEAWRRLRMDDYVRRAYYGPSCPFPCSFSAPRCTQMTAKMARI